MLVSSVPMEAFAAGDAETGTTVEPDTTATEPEETRETVPDATTSADGAVSTEPEETGSETKTTAPAEEPTDAPDVQSIPDGSVVTVTDPDGNVSGYESLQAALSGAFGANGTYAGGNWLITLLGDTAYAERNIQYPAEGASVHLTIDLNGHTIQGVSTATVLYINFGSETPGTLTIQDSVGGGTITGGQHGILFNGTNSTLNFNGGTITGNHGASWGGGILCNSTSAVVNLNGGTITGNSVTGTSSSNTGLGGGVCGYTINVNGTVITGNAAYGGSGSYTGRGGGIATQISGPGTSVNINTNTVYGNTAANAGDDLMIAKNSVCAHSLTIGTENWYVDGWNGASQVKGETARYSVENPVPYTAGGVSNKKFGLGLKYVANTVSCKVTYTDGVEDEVVFNDQTYTVAKDDPTPAFEGTITRKGYVFDGWDPDVAETVTEDATYTATWTVCNHETWKDGEYDAETGTVESVCTVCGETKSVEVVAQVKGTGVYYETLQAAINAADGDTVIVLKDLEFTAEITVKNTVTITADAPVSLTRAGTKDLFGVYANAKLTLEGPLTLVGSTRYGTMVNVLKSGTFVMNDGVTIRDNKMGKTNTAGGVTVTDGTFLMNGGTIDNCGNTGGAKPGSQNGGTLGGGVRIIASRNSTVAASFTMNGGSITNCSCYLGGGIGLENLGAKVPATVVINGGTISGCSSSSGSANYRGGSAIYIYNKTGNVENATVTMYSGAITGNTAKQNGALCTYTGTTGNTYGGKFYILGGVISGNVSGNGSPSSGYGNGIYLDHLVGGKPLLTVGGSAVIADDILLKSSSGNYFEILDGFTGSVKVFVQAAGTGSDAEDYYGTLVAKQVSTTGVASTATGAIAKSIVAVYPFTNSDGKVYEHPSYDIVLSDTAADAYVLGEHPDTFTVTYTDGVEDEVVFEDQIFIVEDGDATPEFDGTPTRKGYIFKGWEPDVADTVTANVTYTATWKVCSHKWDDGTFDEESMSWTYTCTVCGETKAIAAVARLESTGEYYATLQEAVDAADACSQTLTGHNKSVSQTVTLVADTTECVKIDYTPNKNNYYHYTLNIDLNGYTVTGNGTGSVFTINRYTSFNYNLTVVFNDSVGTGTVTGGNTTGNGGAINVSSGKTCYVVINGGTWTGNHADKNGGAIWSSGQTSCPVTINGGVFTGNTAGGNGGAFHIRSLTMTNGTVTGNSAAQGGGLYSFSGYSQILNMTGGKIYGNTATTAGDDIIWRADKGSKTTSYLTLVDAGSMGAEGVNGWFVDNADARYDAENPVEFTDYAKYTTQKTLICLKAAAEKAPEVPTKNGDNVMDDLVKTICDSDADHVSVTSDWSRVNCQVFPTTSAPVWNAELGAWTIGIRIQSLTVQYVAKLEKANNKITHQLVGESLMLATLKWDKEQELWVTLDGEPLEVHATCQTKPAAPVFGQLSSYQIQVYGQVGFENKLYAINLNQDTVTVGEVQGSRKDGFTVDVTVAIAEDDIYQSTWLAHRAPDATLADYTYEWAKTPATITFTLKYTGDLNGTLYGNRNYSGHYDWVLSTTGKHFGKVGEAYLMPAEPADPVQDNVTDKLVAIICDSDPERHVTSYGKWYPTCCKTLSAIVWNDELNAWIVDVKIDSLYMSYVRQFERANNNVTHELVEDATSVYATLKWDVTAKQWVPTESIELHTTCRTAPLAPVYGQLEAYQIKVRGDVNGDGEYGGTGETWTTSIPEGGYTLSEVYGSREEGFYVDVTVNLADGDLYQSRWIEKCDPTHFYKYNWDKTEKTVTFTLRYNGDLNGTLYGNRNAANTNYDWVLSTTGKTWGVVSEAYVDKVMCTVQVVIYRNGEINVPYKQVTLEKAAKGDTLSLADLDIHDYYSSANGFVFEGWFNDGRWNQYKNGETVTGMDEIYINGWTNIICMVTDNQKVVVKAVLNGDKDSAWTVATGVAPKGANVLEWLNENVEIPEKAGYTADAWYNWDWFGHKVSSSATINGWTNVYINYVANTYSVSFNTNGGEDVDPVTVTFGEKYGTLPTASSITGLSSRKNDWYLVGEDGTVTDTNIRNTTVVSVARDHELFLKRDVLEPTLSIKLTVPGGLSDDYKYYIPGNSTRVLTVTVNNRNDELLDYTYQWYKDGEVIEGATEATLTLDGNVSDTGTYKVVVTATLKEDSTIVVETASASGEKTQSVKIMYMANTLRLNENYGENPVTQDNYWNNDEATIRGTATRTGYTFLGWNSVANGSGTMYQDGDIIAFPGANGNGGIVLELYAQWRANTYKITLDANGGKVNKDTVNVTYGEAIGELPTPTRDGYVFCGWVDADRNKVTAETVCDWTTDVKLKATWAVVKPVDPTSPGTGDGMTLVLVTTLLASACALLLIVDRKRRMHA